MKKVLLTVGLACALATSGVMAKGVATINGLEVTLAEANKALDLLTKGEKQWKDLPSDAKQQLIQMMAPSKLVAQAAEKTLSKEEINTALAGYWMQKKMSKIEVTDKEAQAAYDKAVENAKKVKDAKIPPFDKVKNDFKMRVAQEKVVGGLMKNAKIKVK